MAKKTRLKRLLLRSVLLVLLAIVLLYNPLTLRLLTLGIAIYHDLEPGRFYRLVKAESSFRSLAVSSRQAIGLGQVQEATAFYVKKEHKRGLLFVPWYNLDISARYLRYLLNRYNGNWSLALAAYNWGETKVDKRLGKRRIVPQVDYSGLFADIPETRDYINKILK